MSILRVWRTPFEAREFPSVYITNNDGDLNKIVVHVGLPAEWNVHFEGVVGIKISDESYDNNKRFHVASDNRSFCSYIWEKSPWLSDFNAEHVEIMGGLPVFHYVILGGDYNVEILASANVKIESVSSESRF